MKKTICALAMGISLGAPILSFAAEVKVYGRAHVSLDYLDDGKDYNEVALSSNASRLGFKVNHDIHENLNVFAQIEQQINFSSGADDDNDSVDFATRDTYVGVKGNLGQIKVGRFDSPFKAARGPVNYFGDQVGDLRNLTRAYNHRFDERNPNTIEYKSPKFGNGFTATAALSLHDGTMISEHESENNNEKSQAYDVGLNYKNAQWDLAAAYEHYAEDVSRGERDGLRLAAAYKITPDFNLGGLYQYTTHDQDTGLNADAHVYGIAGNYKITAKNVLNAHVFYRDVDAAESNSALVALGLEHRLDSQFRVYGNVAAVFNDEQATLTPWSQARSNKPASNEGVNAKGETASALSIGMRYDF